MQRFAVSAIWLTSRRQRTLLEGRLVASVAKKRP
jgi:hypothetical protein